MAYCEEKLLEGQLQSKPLEFIVYAIVVIHMLMCLFLEFILFLNFYFCCFNEAYTISLLNEIYVEFQAFRACLSNQFTPPLP